MRIEVSGLPAPQGSKRHVGGGRMVESSRAVGPWREAVRAETQRACDRNGYYPIEGAASVSIRFFLPRPKGHYGTGRNAGRLRESAPVFPAARRDDLDKLARAVLDGLTEGGALADDGLVVSMWLAKRYALGRGPGCVINVDDQSEA